MSKIKLNTSGNLGSPKKTGFKLTQGSVSLISAKTPGEIL